jgi:hypothetical protein
MMEKFFKTVLLLALTGCSTVISAQQVVIRAELDTNRALIGDQLNLLLSVEKPVDLRIEFPRLKDTITRNIEIVRDSYTDTTSVSQGRVIFGRNLLITVFDTGFFEIPALDFIAQSGQLRDTFSTLPLQFVILPVAADTILKDIKPNYKAPVNLAEIFYYIKKNYPFGLLAIAIALLTWFIIRYFRKKHGRGVDIQKEIPLELPEVIAMRALEKLKSDKPWMHSRVKLYYTRLSEILRRYIEGRYNIMALEQTTEEILITLKSTPCKASDLNRLTGILKLSDLVKFAKVIPAIDENALQLDLASEFVHNTTTRAEELNVPVDSEDNLVNTNTLTNA